MSSFLPKIKAVSVVLPRDQPMTESSARARSAIKKVVWIEFVTDSEEKNIFLYYFWEL